MLRKCLMRSWPAAVLLAGVGFYGSSGDAYQDKAAATAALENAAMPVWRAGPGLEGFDLAAPSGNVTAMMSALPARAEAEALWQAVNRHAKGGQWQRARKAADPAKVLAGLELQVSEDGATPQLAHMTQTPSVAAATTPMLVARTVTETMLVVPALLKHGAKDAAADGATAYIPPHLAMSPTELAQAKKCLTEAIYFEARGESETGQYAVAQVVMNRVRSGMYPDTVCGVVYQNRHLRNRCQFSFACDGTRLVIRDRKSWAIASRIADEVLKEDFFMPEIGSATHYHATYVRPHWIRGMDKLDRIGSHIFYRDLRWGSEES